MKILVIDASVALSFCLEDERNKTATTLLESLEEYKIIVPPHWWIEVTNGLLMAQRRGRIKADDCDMVLGLLAGIDPEVLSIPPADFAQKITPLANRHKLPAYDSGYLYLAIREMAHIATFDKALRQAAINDGVSIYKEKYD